MPVANIQNIQSCFRRPDWVERKQDYAWKVWLQTLPIAWEVLMATPFGRRQLCNGEATGADAAGDA